MFFCTQRVFSQMKNPVICDRQCHLGMYLHVLGNRCLCPTPAGKWVMWRLHQTLDSNIPVNYTISQSQRWALKLSVLHNSERKEFAGWLWALAEHVAAGEDRGCCWSGLICSCSLCVMLTACSRSHERLSWVTTHASLCPPMTTYVAVSLRSTIIYLSLSFSSVCTSPLFMAEVDIFLSDFLASLIVCRYTYSRC